MKIYNGHFYNADCLEVLKTLDNQSIDLVVTSPPYDDLRSYGGTLEWSFEIFKEIALEINRVLKIGGVIVWIVNDLTVRGSETGNSFRQALFFKDTCGLNLHDTMIWQKSTFSAVGALRVRYAPVFEYMFVLSKGSPKTFNPIKDRPNKSYGKPYSGTVRQKDGSTKPISGVKAGKQITEFGQRFNVWNINEEKVLNKVHPAVFPKSLVKDHIESWSNVGDIVLDPFGGSGTTAVVCEKLSRNWISMEKNKIYYDLAVKRIEESKNE